MFLLLIAVFVFAPCIVQGECNCKTPIQHYKELGCVPYYSECKSSCPLYFNCPNMDRSPNKCYYRGKTYKINEEVEEAGNYGNCVAGCFCSQYSENEIANLVCAIFDCAPPPDDFSEPCYLAGDHNTCCLHEVICPPFDNITKCSVNGTIYYEGQRFISPTYEKLNCLCKPGFAGVYTKPFCIPVNCEIEIYNSLNVRNKCAPVFMEGNVCPVNWVCEQSSDRIEISKEKSAINMKCSYGKKKLNVGDKMNVKSSDVNYSDIKCKCLIPPLLTCFQTYIGS